MKNPAALPIHVMGVTRYKSLCTLFAPFCDKMLIDPLVCFRNGAYFSNELRFELEAEMNGVYDTLW